MKRFLCIFVAVLFCLSFALLCVSADERIAPDDLPFLRDVEVGSYYSLLSFSREITYTHTPSNVTVRSSGFVLFDGAVTHFDTLTFYSASDSPVLRYSLNGTSVSLITAASSFNSHWDGMVYFDQPTSFNQTFVTWYNSFQLVNPIEPNVSDSLDLLGSVFTLPYLWVFISIPVGIFIVGICVSFFKRRFVSCA